MLEKEIIENELGSKDFKEWESRDLKYNQLKCVEKITVDKMENLEYELKSWLILLCLYWKYNLKKISKMHPRRIDI